MENSQKALLIAGSILISIVLISFGIYITSSLNNSMGIDTIDTLSIQVMNSEFERYQGRQRGNMVIDLLDKVLKYNKDYSKNESYSIGICSNDPSIVNNKNLSKVVKDTLMQNIKTRESGVFWESHIKDIKELIVKSQYYNIWFDYNDLNGFIYIVHIDKIN